MTKPDASLRAKFDEALTGTRLFEKHQDEMKQGHFAGLKDFYARFESIAGTLKTDLEKFVDGVREGNIVIRATELYMYQKSPLRFEIAFPEKCAPDQRDILAQRLMNIPGYRKIHEICAGSDVDMDVRTVHRGSAFRNDDGEIVRFNSVVIEIDPSRPYAGPLKAPVKGLKPPGNQP